MGLFSFAPGLSVHVEEHFFRSAIRATELFGKLSVHDACHPLPGINGCAPIPFPSVARNASYPATNFRKRPTVTSYRSSWNVATSTTCSGCSALDPPANASVPLALRPIGNVPPVTVSVAQQISFPPEPHVFARPEQLGLDTGGEEHPDVFSVQLPVHETFPVLPEPTALAHVASPTSLPSQASLPFFFPSPHH
jgi:hypothetical protein